MLFQLVAVGYLALGNLISIFAKKRVEDGYFTFLVQHSEADLPLECDGDRHYGMLTSPMLMPIDQVEWPGMVDCVSNR